MLDNLWTLFKLELILLFRRSHEWLYAIAFFFIVIILFPLAFSADAIFLQKIFPGCVWIAALLAILLSVENIFFSDLEDGSLEQCLLNPLPLSFFIAIKLLAHWCVCALPLMLAVPFLGLLFHLDLFAICLLSLSLIITTPLIIALCCLSTALTIGLRQQGVILGLIMLPLAIPLIIFGVGIVQQAQNGLAIQGPLAFLSGISILAMTILPWAIAATLRMSLDE